MKYTKDERLYIGRQVVTNELSRTEAMLKYDITSTTIDNYVRLYKDSADIPTKEPATKLKEPGLFKVTALSSSPDIETYMAMSKEELINELIKAKANELRAKKGYVVKGVGANKEFIPLNKPNSKS